jgi:hypothetical protein
MKELRSFFGSFGGKSSIAGGPCKIRNLNYSIKCTILKNVLSFVPLH